MKILIIQPWIRLGGAELVSMYLASELVKSGQDAEIICAFSDLDGRPLDTSNVRLRLPPSHLARILSSNHLLFLLLGPWILLWLVWRHSTDTDVLNSHEFPTTWIAVIVGAIRNIPVVWSSYGPPPKFPLSEIRNIGIADWIGWKIASSNLDRLLVRKVAAVHVPSSLTRTQIRERYSLSPAVIPLGVDSTFYGGGDASNATKRYDLDGKFTLLCVGKLHPQENQIVCLQVLGELLEEDDSVMLLIAGEGPMLGRLKSLAAEWGLEGYVRFLGHLPSADLRDVYKASTLHLYPPIGESWGLAPFEALSVELPSIVSRDSGAAEIFVRGPYGIVAEPNVADIARSIHGFRKNPRAYASRALAGKEYISEHLPWEQYGHQALRLMADVKLNSNEQISQVGAEAR